MNDRPKSLTRQQLETSVRALLPRASDIPESLRNTPTATAGVGMGGVLAGFTWGWLRGRRSRRN